MKRYIGLTLLFLFTVMCTNSYAVEITVGSGSAQPTQSVILPITVDVPGEIAGAAFTLTYDSNMLALTSATSTFFDTFTNQWTSLAVPDPLPPGTVDVDGQTYNQPLIINGMSIAAARCKAGATSTTLFTLTFTVKASATPGQLPVSIVQTVLSNVNAGYATPEAVPILIGALENELDLALAYPALTTTVVSGIVTVLPAGIVDVDLDGIDDTWEMTHFVNLTTANATSDYDKDGYSDKQEYLNSKNGLIDPAASPYDPKVKNAPYGAGFSPNEILWRNTVTGQNVCWYMGGVDVIGWGQMPTVPVDSNWEIVGTGDFNYDGKPDIIWRNTVTGQNVFWYMDGVDMIGWGQMPTVPVDSNWEIVGADDFNYDGKPDILWRNTVTGQNVFWYMDGVDMIGWGQIPTVPVDSNWEIMGAGDFNYDGKPDILWRNTVSGENVFWYIDGVDMIGWGQMPTVPVDSNWEIVGTGDFNYDGKPDILWRNTVSGEAVFWYMDGVDMIGWGQIPTVPVDSNWEIVGP